MQPVVGHLVYLKSPLPKAGYALVAQKWPQYHVPTNGEVEVARHPLIADEWKLTIAVLEARYPAPKMPEAN